MALYEEWRENLKKYYLSVRDNIDLPSILEYCYSQEIVTQRIVAEIRECTSVEKVEKFLTAVLEISKENFKVFVLGLKETGQGNIRDLLMGVSDGDFLSKDQQEALRKHHTTLVENMEPDMVIEYLKSKDVLTSMQRYEIKEKSTNMEKNLQLLEYIRKGTHKAFDIFVNALRDCNQEHLAGPILQNTGHHPLFSPLGEVIEELNNYLKLLSNYIWEDVRETLHGINFAKEKGNNLLRTAENSLAGIESIIEVLHIQEDQLNRCSFDLLPYDSVIKLLVSYTEILQACKDVKDKLITLCHELIQVCSSLLSEIRKIEKNNLPLNKRNDGKLSEAVISVYPTNYETLGSSEPSSSSVYTLLKSSMAFLLELREQTDKVLKQAERLNIPLPNLNLDRLKTNLDDMEKNKSKLEKALNDEEERRRRIREEEEKKRLCTQEMLDAEEKRKREEQIQREEEEKRSQEEERKAREEAEKKKREEQLQKEAEEKRKQEEKRKAEEEAEKKRIEKQLKREAEEKRKEEEKRKAEEEAEKKRREEQLKKEAEEKRKEEEKRKAEEEAEKKRREEQLKMEAEEKRKEEEKRKAEEEAEKKRREEQLKREAEEKRKQKEEERKQKQKEEEEILPTGPCGNIG